MSTIVDSSQEPIPNRLISIVVPCFNEEDVIAATHERITDTLGTSSAFAIQIVYVDDGSGDRTADLLRGLVAADSRVTAVLLSRNFGHQYAVSAGLEHATGDAAVIMDADLQDPPSVALELIDRWQAGADVVVGVRAERRGESAFKLRTAALFYRALNAVSDVSITNDAGDFRLLDRKVVDALIAMPERDRFIRGMVSWLGFRQVNVEYRREARYAGVTKYSLVKMIRLAIDGFVSFSIAPLRLASMAGTASFIVAMLGIGYALVLRLLTQTWVPGWTLLFIAVLFIGGIQLLSLGVIGEYVGRIYSEGKRRPLYVVREVVHHPDSPSRGLDTT